jgi:hypothetical protein
MADPRGYVGRKNIGSQVRQTQVSQGNKKTPVSLNTGTIRQSASRPRGSLEGYMYAPAAHININGRGYGAKSIQHARGTKSSMDLRMSIPSGPRVPNAPVDRVTNHIGASGGSVGRLRQLTKLNRLF